MMYRCRLVFSLGSCTCSMLKHSCMWRILTIGEGCSLIWGWLAVFMSLIDYGKPVQVGLEAFEVYRGSER